MQDVQERAEATEYEAPELAEAGRFTERTLGFTGEHSDNWGGMHSTFW
ncbi:lasso RiPP family leader peptide-containing protein [Streptomyces monomycini]|nr:lasso RiPP family leader peptide-containing protein [Streptomyces monomycini]